MVGVERFELPTSWSQTRRATRLRYTPIYYLKRCASQVGAHIIDGLQGRQRVFQKNV